MSLLCPTCGRDPVSTGYIKKRAVLALLDILKKEYLKLMDDWLLGGLNPWAERILALAMVEEALGGEPQ